jgi:hypothetical protein
MPALGAEGGHLQERKLVWGAQARHAPIQHPPLAVTLAPKHQVLHPFLSRRDTNIQIAFFFFQRRIRSLLKLVSSMATVACDGARQTRRQATAQGCVISVSIYCVAPT